MYSSVLYQTHQALVIQLTELQNLRRRVLKAEQRMLGRRRRAGGRGALGKGPLGRKRSPRR